jgi:D-aspartate ligase
MDLIRPLGMARIPCVAIAGKDDPVRFSRFVRAVVELPEPLADDALVRRLVPLARRSTRPTLFYEEDAHLLMLSRHRRELGQVFRFVVADADLIEDLVDKERFQALSARLSLPVPRAFALTPAGAHPERAVELGFPVIVKPLPRRTLQWRSVMGFAKAVRVDDEAALRTVLTRLAEVGMRVLVQELVAGSEQRIESYHAYVDADGDVVGEFTGRKLRTHPPEFGISTALVTTDAADVAAAGRDVIAKLGLRGVAKLDYKRTASGDLRLLEVNPRFNLWHHLGAAAGVNLPALVHADLTESERPAGRSARPGVTWSLPWRDLAAARSMNVSPLSWLAWTLRADVNSVVAWDDPLPLLRGKLWPGVRARASFIATTTSVSRRTASP